MSRKKWKLLVDFDGTLHDTETIFSSKLDGLFGLDGKTLYNIYLFDIHRKLIHENFPERHNDTFFHFELLCDFLKKPVNENAIALLEARFREAETLIFRRPLFFKDAKTFLDKAFFAGHRLCLSSGGGNSRTKADTIKKFFMKNYFDKVIGEETMNCLKDDPLYYRKALQRLSWKNNEVVSIGDSLLTDIYPAKSVGIKTVWVNRKKGFRHLNPDKCPDYVTKDLVSVIDYLSSMSVF